MSTASAYTGDPILRAYANLKAVRDNLGPGLVYQESHYKMFNRALDELQQAGIDVSEWRLPSGAVGVTHASEIKARIDAILMYFNVSQEKTPIGFRK
jgi:hypothetical protein